MFQLSAILRFLRYMFFISHKLTIVRNFFGRVQPELKTSISGDNVIGYLHENQDVIFRSSAHA